MAAQRLDDSIGRPVTRQLDRYYEVLAQANAVTRLVEQQDALAANKLRPFLLRIYTQDALVRGMNFQTKLPASWAVWVAS